jgi:hypothetical protein
VGVFDSRGVVARVRFRLRCSLMPSRRSETGTFTIRAPEAFRAWRDARRLAALLEAVRTGRKRPRRHGRGPDGTAALALRAFTSLRRSLVEMCVRAGVTREQIDAVLLPNPHLPADARARRAARIAAETQGTPAEVVGEVATEAPAREKSKPREKLRGRVQWHRPG